MEENGLKTEQQTADFGGYDKLKTLTPREHIRQRPGMYIGKLGDGSQSDDGVYVLIKEVVDNSIDEFNTGYAKPTITIDVADGAVTIRDYGRGIPLDQVRDASSKMNTGAKYDTENYKRSVGLNGVGIKAVNALSTEFYIRSVRAGQASAVLYHEGKVVEETGVIAADPGEENGTLVRFKPDGTIFKNYEFREEIIEQMIKNYSYLNTGLTLTFNGKLNLNGSWFIPGTVSEVKKTDLEIDVSARIKEGLMGITADIRSDSTLYQPPKFNYIFPIRLRGHLENGILNMSEISTQNDSGETVSGTLRYNLDSLRIMDIEFQSDRYTLVKGPHKLVAENIIGRMEENEDELVISGSIGDIHYNFTDESFGEAEAIGRSELSLTIPHSHDGILQNKTISGNVSVDKLVYHKDLEIEVTPATIDKFITLFNNALARLRHQEAEVKYSSAEPINLSIHINDSQTDSIQIVTPFATFPLTFDVWVLGNTNRPLLRGDVMNANTGFIGMQEVYEFELNSFRISWTDVPWQHGVVDVSSSQELPYCDEIENAEKETCPVNLDFQGTITNLQPTPSSNCGNESSAASIYYNIILGCIANQDNEATDWNKVAGKAIGKMISTTANKTLGGDYIGNIDMKVMLFENNTTNERDSSYFKLPISLDRWVKDLSLIFGYTQDQSENPTYDQSLQFGLNYTLPVFKDKSYSHKNHISPTTSLYAQLVSKQYLTNTGTEGNENRVEKNIGINYVYRYWNPCLLGIGKCETIQNPYEKKDETKPPLKKSETNK